MRGLLCVLVLTAAAPAYARSFEQGRPVSCEATTRIADGVACRTPDPEALRWIRSGVDRMIEVTDDEIEEGMRAIYEDTHNVAEGAAGVALAGLLQERDRLRGSTAAIVLTGGNVDSRLFAPILSARETTSLRSR